MTFASVWAANAQKKIPTSAAEQAFSRFHVLCTADHGKIWGVSLCGPMMFVELKSRAAVLNRPVAGATRDSSVWRIKLPKDQPLANTSIKYKGRRWIMILWPIFKTRDKTDRDILMMHEAFHRIQLTLELPMSGIRDKNGQLGTRRGRIWLRGEFNALRDALSAHGQKRKKR
jgi:hypothetical protein